MGTARVGERAAGCCAPAGLGCDQSTIAGDLQCKEQHCDWSICAFVELGFHVLEDSSLVHWEFLGDLLDDSSADKWQRGANLLLGDVARYIAQDGQQERAGNRCDNT